MRARVRRPSKVKRDIAEVAARIAEDSESAAWRFVEATERVFDFLSRNPDAGAPRPELSGGRLSDLRMWPVGGFEKYLVFYRHVGGEVQILRVLHGARDLAALLEDDG
ncbi:MAG: type II toxin-antitoxin system RelE/ParE family toxin [Candidatus Methylomirabilis sp.]|nr:type II toxin-antitoxin system RelE/ParE family toxin [Deltaproteobacteria bacterium]